MSEESEILENHEGKAIRLTAERWEHILVHPEMTDQKPRIIETLKAPDKVIETNADASIHVYQRLYPQTPVTRKHLLVVVKQLEQDAFVVTAFFTSREKKGKVIWQK